MVVFDPQYDSYASICQRVNAKVVSVPLTMNEDGLTFDRRTFAAAFTPATKLLLLNTPHNPTGKVFTREELEFIAQLVMQHDVYVILDEVYEHLVFPPQQHVSLRQLPDMQSRCIRIGSAGKTFSFTAWKVCACFHHRSLRCAHHVLYQQHPPKTQVGWATGPAHLISAVAKAHQFLVFTVPSALQAAVAHGLDHEAQFFTSMGTQLQRKRAMLQQRLTAIGFTVLPAEGTYFLLADIR